MFPSSEIRQKDASYSMVVLYIRDHAVLGFLTQKNITLKPASNFLHNNLAALLRHSQPLICLQSDSKPVQVSMEILKAILTN